MRRLLHVGLMLALLATSHVTAEPSDDVALPSCPARVSDVGVAAVHWLEPAYDRPVLDAWCRAVGPPLSLHRSARATVAPMPSLDDLVVITWNAHLAEGRLAELVDALRAGQLTSGQPVRHFVLLVQEVYRRGATVPTFAGHLRSARAIRARNPESLDIAEQATRLGLTLLYVPSMRNGADMLEDRGNAILSTEPIETAFAFELPFERQRRVAIGGSVPVMLDGRPSVLRVVNAHLEPLSSPRSLWIFHNPRRRQIAAILDVLQHSRFEDDVAWAGTVLGGDFNTVQRSGDEAIYRDARAWGHSLEREDPRRTHRMGRLDYLFVRLPRGWAATSSRIDRKFGSDHHPVLGRLTREGLSH